MSILSAVKNLVAKVNDHTEDLKGFSADIDEILERLDTIESGEVEPEAEGKPGESNPDEEDLKLEE